MPLRTFPASHPGPDVDAIGSARWALGQAAADRDREELSATQRQADARRRRRARGQGAAEAMGDADGRERGALQESRHDVEQDVIGGWTAQRADRDQGAELTSH